MSSDSSPARPLRIFAWPTAAQYNEAIQNLPSSMTDEELRGGEVALNPLGMPLLYSGGFADVYRVHCPQTNNTWAVKCFTRGATGLKERYQAISECLDQARLPFMVDFRYLPEGVRIGDGLFPIVKMRWIEGQNLNQFVAGALDQPAMLDQLFGLWIKLAARLDEAGIAHADLQHGNVVLVPRGEQGQVALRLIDYDGMFVPALAGRPSGEAGLGAYQHPRRQRDQIYSAAVDRFSHLVICTAVRCLRAGGRSLWERFNNDENLLFREPDLQEPSQSALFRELWTLRDPDARALVGHLLLATLRPLPETPLVLDLIAGNRVRALTWGELRAVQDLFGGATVSDSTASSPAVTVAASPARAPQEVIDAANENAAVEKTSQPDEQRVTPRLGGLAILSAIGRALGWTVTSADRMLAKLVGDENWLLHQFMRLVTVLCVMVGLPCAVIWGIPLLRTKWADARQAERLLAEAPAPDEKPTGADPFKPSPESQALESQRLALAAEANVRALLTEKFAPRSMAEGERLQAAATSELKRPNLPAAERLYRQATEQFAQAQRDAPEANQVGKRRQQWTQARTNAESELTGPAGASALRTADDDVKFADGLIDREDYSRATLVYDKALATLEQALAKQAKSGRTDFAKSIGLGMIPIPIGKFSMGSNDAFSDEKPAHEVQISQPFELGETEVTVGQVLKWLEDVKVIDEAWMDLGNSDCPIERREKMFALRGGACKFGQSVDQPMVCISHAGAVAFCAWLTTKDLGTYIYRLPMEAEWEYASRAGSTKRFSHGESESELGNYAWYSSNAGGATQVVRTKLSNQWGLFDLHGNVREWCSDWYDSSYYAQLVGKTAVNPQGPSQGVNRVIRGGSWADSAQDCRSALRVRFGPSYWSSNLGFRVARSPSGK